MKICIDAGHNNSLYDTGATGIGGVREQDITFQLAKALETILRKEGIETVMTRKNASDNLGYDLASSLNERARISNENGCDFFLSIHCNSSSPLAEGAEAFISAKGGEAGKKAALMLENISKSVGTINRGVRVDTEYLHSKLYVLHNTACPAVLLEAGFITNADDVKKLTEQTEDYAVAVAKAFTMGGDEVERFTDIKDHWAKAHIEKLADYGVVNGFDDGTFKPDEPLKRGEAAAIVSNALSVLGK